MTEALIAALAEALAPVMDRQKAMRYGVALKHDISGTPSGAIYSHGPGGLLSFPGVDPVMFNATMGHTSILGELPATPSVYTNPTYWTITGVQADTGSEMDGVCDNAPTAGLMKGCLATSVFGRYERATPLLEVNRLGQRTDRSDPVDLRLVGSPIATGGPFQTMSDINSPSDVFTNEVSRKFWERNVSFYRQLSRQIWVGNPTNNSAGLGYKEMTGLQTLVNTGYKDAESGVACPAMDSYVVSFGNVRVDSSTSQIVAAVTNAYHQVKTRAEGMGLMPVRWALAMRSGLFYELTSIWPCSYLSYRCSVSPGMAEPMNGVIDAQDAVRLRDEMRAGKYLLIDGDRVDVIVDDGIPESDGNEGTTPRGCFATDIYLLPFSVVGGQSTLFMEYFQFQNTSIQDALGGMILGRIEGAFITWPRQTNMCVQWQSKIEPRLVLRTPWLAARITDVNYCPIQHTRDSFPDDPYFTDGGKTSRPGPSYYSIWQS